MALGQGPQSLFKLHYRFTVELTLLLEFSHSLPGLINLSKPTAQGIPDVLENRGASVRNLFQHLSGISLEGQHQMLRLSDIIIPSVYFSHAFKMVSKTGPASGTIVWTN